MLGRDRLADRAFDVVDGDATHLRPLDLLHHDEPLLAMLVQDREGGAAMPAQGRMARLNGVLQVLRIVVDAANDDHVLDAPGDEELARVVEKPEIAGAKPALLGFPFDARAEGRGGGLGVLPIALGDIRAGNPDLADITRSKPAARFRIDDREPFADEGLAAACEELRVLFARRRGCAIALQRLPAHPAR